MCTVSFIPRQRDYLLAMNRDEQRSRVAGLPPMQKEGASRNFICPSEPGGGTWIALNAAGVTFALINWYSITRRVKGNSVSRGIVVNSVAEAEQPEIVLQNLRALQLEAVNPFRLIGVFPQQRTVVEWGWNLENLCLQEHPWQARQFISSGFDEPAAQQHRSAVFQTARGQKSVFTADWLRRLHRSHRPGCGALSTCMHREDAVTVSYTEIQVTALSGRMSYHGGAPCHQGPTITRSFPVIVGKA